MDEEIQHISEHMPFRKEIIAWLGKHPDVIVSLKLMAVNRFVHFSGISIVEPHGTCEDQILGIVVYDLKLEKLKQDFLVDIKNEHTRFTYFTNLPKARSHLYDANIKHINEFGKIYGTNGKFNNTHHPDIASLHPELQARIRQYLTLTKRKLR